MISFEALDVIFYKCHSYSILGDIQNTKLYFSFIQDMYSNSEEKKILQQYLDKEKLKELKRIKKEVESGNPIEELESINPIDDNIEPSANDLKLEKQIVKLSYYNLQKLEKFLGKNLECKGIERETYLTGGKCDMVLQNDQGTLFPIEFKLNQANHSVVSQIDKYCLHFKLQLIYKLYNRVQGVVIASSFSKYAINALLKRNIICLQYSCVEDNVKFKLIKNSYQ